MVRTIGFKHNVMTEALAGEIIDIFPNLVQHFETWRMHDQMVFRGNNVLVALDLADLESLTENFSIRMDDDFIEVEM